MTFEEACQALGYEEPLDWMSESSQSALVATVLRFTDAGTRPIDFGDANRIRTELEMWEGAPRATAVCLTCRHLDLYSEDDESPVTCDAYPDGIPLDIVLWGIKHDQPRDGDHGILYARGQPHRATLGETRILMREVLLGIPAERSRLAPLNRVLRRVRERLAQEMTEAAWTQGVIVEDETGEPRDAMELELDRVFDPSCEHYALVSIGQKKDIEHPHTVIRRNPRGLYERFAGDGEWLQDPSLIEYVSAYGVATNESVHLTDQQAKLALRYLLLLRSPALLYRRSLPGWDVFDPDRRRVTSTVHFRYNDDWETALLECPACGWRGAFKEGSVGHYADLMDCSCPMCPGERRLAIVSTVR